MTSNATNTPAGFTRIGLFDRLESIESRRPVTDEGMHAKQLKRDLIASAFAPAETAGATVFCEAIEAEWYAARDRPPALPDAKKEI